MVRGRAGQWENMLSLGLRLQPNLDTQKANSCFRSIRPVLPLNNKAYLFIHIPSIQSPCLRLRGGREKKLQICKLIFKIRWPTMNFVNLQTTQQAVPLRSIHSMSTLHWNNTEEKTTGYILKSIHIRALMNSLIFYINKRTSVKNTPSNIQVRRYIYIRKTIVVPVCNIYSNICNYIYFYHSRVHYQNIL